jgi:hypothetical protein
MFSDSRVDDGEVFNNVLLDKSLTSPVGEGLTKSLDSFFKMSLERLAGTGEGV